MNLALVGRVLRDNQFGRSNTMGMRLISSGLALVFMTVLVTTAASAQTVSVPRTPWGDPDIQGNYTNTYEQGTPLERPEQFAGRALEDVKGEELARVRRQIQERTVGNFQGPIHAPDHWWQDRSTVRTGLVELQKLAVDVVVHPLSW